ncbi:MAG TPA: bifunctional DNA-formamidopyrimidine glycosylase/DNA-(apurinic or apyrimidinic site) lyase [Candidatus Paceibacterota bacterium]|nr:bifunctional DNA-formamidopyrimidine glycosylase/DNA-(apurinic or apyrimidinic site) lyase [Candidatus Paceibacterota bacterium]
MPELPEVESLRRSLEKVILGQTVRKIEVLAPKLVSGKGNVRTPSPAKTKAFVSGLEKEKIISIDRRAKNLIFRFSHGKVMIVHLKMTGQLVYKEKGKKPVTGGHPIELSETELPNKHTRLIFHLGRGTLYYNDTRMFGYLLYHKSLEEAEKLGHFSDLGVEPLDAGFTLEYFRDSLKARRGTLKKVLMDQKVVTGLGNIYADEVAYEAGVRPTRQIAKVTGAEIEKLYKAIKRTMEAAISLGGSSVADYLLADGSRGNYAREHKVYGKTGENCPKCGTKLRTLQLNGRTTVYCPQCQK